MPTAQRPEGMILRKAKLSTLKPQISTIKPLIGRATGDEKARLRQRDQEIEWRAWYGTERWKQMRKRVWARDAYTCQVTGTLCIGKYPAGNSPVADHKIPHRGGEVLYDISGFGLEWSPAYRHGSDDPVAWVSAITGERREGKQC